MNTLLDEREKTHGDFANTAMIAQDLKIKIRQTMREWDKSYTSIQLEVIDMICSKLARICAGDADEPDHWRDIAGYATLALKELEK